MKQMATLGLLIGLLLFLPSAPAAACSCAWRGPFLVVSRGAPLVIRGRVLRHHLDPVPAMDVLVLETLQGGVLDSGMVVQMGDGMHCRPLLEGFPPQSEWLLALNGPGAKPGDGWALSLCGEYWLRMEKDEVIGSIDGQMGEVKRMPWPEFRGRFLYPRFQVEFAGRAATGEGFCRPFGSRFEFILEPLPTGWEVVVRECGRDENLARLTPPLHFAPNPREIEGWQFLDDPAPCASRPYGAEAGPANPREFIFSPDVGRRVGAGMTGRAVTVEEIETVRRFGRGSLAITGFKLEAGSGGCPGIAWLEFSVWLEGGL
jgi:hypothetical protein